MQLLRQLSSTNVFVLYISLLLSMWNHRDSSSGALFWPCLGDKIERVIEHEVWEWEPNKIRMWCAMWWCPAWASLSLALPSLSVYLPQFIFLSHSLILSSSWCVSALSCHPAKCLRPPPPFFLSLFTLLLWSCQVTSTVQKFELSAFEL